MSKPKERRKVLLLGDFVRMAIQPRVAELLAADPDMEIEVVGPPASSGTSGQLAEQVSEFVKAYQPDAVYFNAGLEDAVWHHSQSRNEVSIADYTMNLQHVIDALRPYLGGDIIFGATTPVIDDLQCRGGDSERSNRDLEEYNGAAQQLMLANNVLFHRLDEVIMADESRLLAEDGVSLSSDGVEAAAESVANAIRRLWH